MRNIHEYINEKLHLNKDIEVSYNYPEKPIDIMSKYLENMIITPEEKYIKTEVVTVLKTWLEENDIHDVYCYLTKDDYENANESRLKNLSYDDTFDDISYIERTKLSNVLNDAEVLYLKRMKNQFVKITIHATNSILGYYDNFLTCPIIFKKK